LKRLLSLFLVLLVVAAGTVTGCKEIDNLVTHDQESTPIISEDTQTTPDTAPSDTTSTAFSSELLTVSILDVGQADCIIIQQGDNAMIIDAGNNADSIFVVDQLQNMGIDRLDVVIGTHPHEDHIGGLDAVINNFDIGTIYMPKVSNNTKTFEDVLIAIQKKGLSVTTPVPGTGFTLGDEVQCLILAPNSASYEDLNNYSIVLKVTYNGKSFLFTGDAEIDSEEEMLAKGYDLKADVLKVGHHGSTSSTSDEFLQAVSPEYAVICVGVDNTYGHPHQETLDKLNAAGIKIYRTDLNGGTIKFVVDRNQLSVTIEK
jgi:competence protein ComEC